MRIDIAQGRFLPDAGPFISEAKGRHSIVAIADGTASWGSGIAAAREVSQAIRRRWDVDPPDDSSTLARHVVDALAQLPQEVRDDSFGYAFAFVAALLDVESWHVLSCGWYGCIAVYDGAASIVVQPSMWVDEQVRAGLLSPAEARVHQLRHVYGGPLVGDSGGARFEHEAIGTPDTLVIVSAELMRQWPASEIAGFGSALELQNAGILKGTRPDPVVIISAD